jgi:N-acetyl-gamma-glutamyl-phosphate reductase
MLKVAIVGSSGYAGGELCRILLGHKNVEITAVTSERSAGRKVSTLFPQLTKLTDLVLEPLDPDTIGKKADFFFLAVPHLTAMSVAARFIGMGKKVVDLSADFRFRDPAIYQEWYGESHLHPELTKKAVYGLPELHRADIAKAILVGNPGCYPTSAILAMAPLLKECVVDEKTLIVDSKSGVSGAGRTPALPYHFPEANESLMAYKIGEHRHTPEIEQELSLCHGEQVLISFTPHLVPMNRGILTTAYAKLKRAVTEDDIREIYNKHYKDEFFVRVLEEKVFPNVANVRGSNFCDINFKLDHRTGRVVVVSAIDNLVKGAAGQAVQNMNLMNGFNETEGLLTLGMFP